MGDAYEHEFDYKPGDVIRAAQDYVVVKALGAGGMGAVYLAKHRVLYRPFAVKLLHAELFHRPELIEMFGAEARTIARLGEPEPHPGIIEVVDLGRTKDRGCMPYMVMPYLVGETLREALDRRGTLPVLESIGIVTRVLQALDHAHRRGVLHRDVKTDNIFIPQVSEGTAVKVLDWGISKLVAQARDPRIFLGTPAWASREQLLGEGVGPLSDVYSAAVVLFRCLTGTMPFAAFGAELNELRAVIDIPAPRLRDLGDFPPALDRVLARALARDPAERPADALAFATELQAVGRALRPVHEPPSSAPLRPRAVGEVITEAHIASPTVEDEHVAARMAQILGKRPASVPERVVAFLRSTVPMASRPRPRPRAPVAVVSAASLPPAATRRRPVDSRMLVASVIATLVVTVSVAITVRMLLGVRTTEPPPVPMASVIPIAPAAPAPAASPSSIATVAASSAPAAKPIVAPSVVAPAIRATASAPRPKKPSVFVQDF